MGISDQKKEEFFELVGSQKLSPSTAKEFLKCYKGFKFHFSPITWYGNTPIDPSAGSLTFTEAVLWIQFAIDHLRDWVGHFNQELVELENALNALMLVVKAEVASALADIISEYDLFNVIVTGNNERFGKAASITTSTTKDQTLFSYGFRTERGLIEAAKTTLTDDDCLTDNSIWVFHVAEKDGENLIDYFSIVNNIPSAVNRVWAIGKENETISDEGKEIYFIYDNQLRKGSFSKENASKDETGASISLVTLNTNYKPQWIVNVFKRVVGGKNYLRYLTDDYKCYEYDLDSGEETFIYQIPADKRSIFDPIGDVIEGVCTIWAVTYRGTANRFVKEINGLCYETCFDGVELYDTWETPKKVVFTENLSGIVPANMYINYADKSLETGNKKLLSAFILTEKTEENPYTLDFWQLAPRNFDNSIISNYFDEYFKDAFVTDVLRKQRLSDYQGFFSYNLGSDLSNFTDAPMLLVNDTVQNEDIKIVLENSQFIDSGAYRTFWQRLRVITSKQDKTAVNRVYERIIKQQIKLNGIVTNEVGRWYDATRSFESEKIDAATNTKAFDYHSLAGTTRIFNAADFENQFEDTPIDTYKYYDYPLKKDHPLLTELEKKNVIVEVTKGTTYEADSEQYESVIKVTYQDDYAELQMRRLMRFNRKEDATGGRTRATFVSPWAYVYYTVPDDSAPDEYIFNPNQGIDIKFNEIIQNLQDQIDEFEAQIIELTNKIENLTELVNNLTDEVNQVKQEIKEINNKITKIEADITELTKTVEENSQAIIVLQGRVNDLTSALQKIIDNLFNSGAITTNEINTFEFVSGRNIATGNINLFGGTADGTSFIRTNKGKTENDIAAGIATTKRKISATKRKLSQVMKDISKLK